MSISLILHYELIVFLYSLGAIVAYQLLAGKINTQGLLQQKNGSGETSPERVQLLLATLAAAARFLSEASTAQNGQMPDIGNEWLYLIGGSSALYLLRKSWVTWNSGTD
jgi:hypothetical protein